MNKIIKSIIAVLAVSVMIGGFAGCKEKGSTMGDAGQKIDQSVNNASKNINTAVDKVGQKIEKTGQKIENSVKDKKK